MNFKVVELGLLNDGNPTREKMTRIHEGSLRREIFITWTDYPFHN